MLRFSSGSLVWVLAFTLILGCSSGGAPVTPVIGDLSAPPIEPVDLSQGAPPGESNHHLWSYHLIRVDPSTLDFKVIPLRDAALHLNVLSWLEQSPCMDCFKLTGIVPSGTGTLLLSIRIRNPYVSPNFTGFDVRGIAMFNASHAFPASGLTFSDRAMGDVVVLNADGYTTLYNPTTAGFGPGGLEGYIKGKLASQPAPNGRLNAFKRFISEDPSNTRNAFYAADSVKVTYEVAMPSSPFLFGYAVDASWAQPVNKPVKDPMTDFGPEANCPEAWKIEFVKAEGVGGTWWTNCGGQVKLTFDIYDWQGVDSVHLPRLECHELFDGEVEATWKADGPGFSRYEAMMENVKHAPPGNYLFLIRKEAKEDDPVGKPWLDLRAYEVFLISVAWEEPEKPTAVAEANQENALIGQEVFFDGSGSHDNDCGGVQIVKYEWDWEGDGLLVEGPGMTSHAWDSEGIYYVQLQVTDDDGLTDTLDQPLKVTVSEQGFNPVDVTPPWLNFTPQNICTNGNRLYVAGEGALHIFEMTNPTTLEWRGWVKMYSSSVVVDASGDYAYVADAHDGLLIIDVSQPVFAHVEKVVGKGATNGRDLVVSDGFAYLAHGYRLTIVDIDPTESASIVGNVDLPNDARAVAVSDGYAYVANGNGELEIVDIDPPEEAAIVKTVGLPGYPNDVAVSEGYAFVADDNSRMQIVDVDPVESASVVYTVATPGRALGVTVSGGYAYVSCGKYGLEAINVKTPESAFVVKTLAMPGDARGVSVSGDYAYVADAMAGVPIVNIAPPETASIAAIKDTAYLASSTDLAGNYAIVAAGAAGVEIVDIAPPDSAWIVRSVDTPGSARSVAVSGDYAYVADSSSGLQILSIAPPDSACIMKAVETPTSTGGIAVDSGFAYVTSMDGLVIIDVDPISDAHILNQVDLPIPQYAWPGAVAVSGGYAYATSEDGLQIIDVDPPESAFVVNVVPMGYCSYPRAIAISGNYACVGSDQGGFKIVDINPPESASILNTVSVSYARGIAVSGGYAYTAGNDLEIFDIDPPESAFPVLTYPASGYCDTIALSGKYAYLASTHGSGGLRIVKLW